MKRLRAYYNEFDPKAAAWLRQLIKNKDITDGEVDERSITEVEPSDLDGFDRCHFFAGIGTWDYCLNQAGWGDKPIWTASLPCQPFSAAGKGLGKADERHLLPHFLELVRQCKPDTIIGEQVEAAIRHGWLDDLQANMEAEGYAVGHCVLGAHSIGAPHIRQRLYWLANATGTGLEGARGETGLLAVTGENRWMGNTEHDGHTSSKIKRSDGEAIQDSETGTDSTCESKGASASSFVPGSDGGMADTEITSRERAKQGGNGESYNGELDWIYCRDNKYRPIKPGIFPLVDGIAKGMVYSSDPSAPINANATQEARVMRLKGYGNAIQTQTATAFIKAYMNVKEEI